MLVVIRGAGDIATGIALRLFSLGHKNRHDRPAAANVHPADGVLFRGHPPRLRDGRGCGGGAREATPLKRKRSRRSGRVAVLADPQADCA